MRTVSLIFLCLHVCGLVASASFEVEGRNPNFPFNWITISDGAGPNQVTNFGSVTNGSQRDRRFRFTNTHSSAIYFWTGSSSTDADFEILTSSGGPLGNAIVFAPGISREFIVRYTPSKTSASATIRLDSNAPGSTNPYTFSVVGVGLIPDARISGRSGSSGGYDNILDGETTPSVSEGTDFGFIPVGNSFVRHFKLTNDGNTPLDPGSYYFLGTFGSSFQVSGLSLSNLGAGNSREFTITFTPSVSEVIEATFELVSDDPDENPYSFRVRGEGVTYPDIRVRGLQGAIPTTIDDGDHTPDQQVTQFGNVTLGQTGTRTFRVVNDGTATLDTLLDREQQLKIHDSWTANDCACRR